MLYMLPNVLSDSQKPNLVLSPLVSEVVEKLDGMICETEKLARSYLKHFQLKMPIQDFPLLVLDEHNPLTDEHLKGLEKNETWALLSDAGTSAIADPGKELIARLNQKKIEVRVIPGPCSITQALQLSGFSGQRFCFWGYLARNSNERKKELQLIEKNVKGMSMTYLFIETPYRNLELYRAITETLHPRTRLAIVSDIDSPEQSVRVDRIGVWKKEPEPDIYKKPAIFLISG